VSFTIPHDNLSVGSGAPAADMSNVADVLTGMGVNYNVLNTAWGSADPTGSADSTIAIQAALTACSNAGGGTVLIPPGVYLITQSLQIGSNTTLAGAGIGITTIRASAGFAPTQVGTNGGAVMLAGAGNTSHANVAVTGITFDMNRANITAIPGYADAPECAPVSLQNITGLVVDKCQVINAVGYSVYLFGCASFTISNCRVLTGQSATNGTLTFSQQDGIHVSASQNGAVTGNNVDTGTIGNVGDDGIALQSRGTGGSAIANVTVTGNIIRAASAGIDLAMSGGPVSGVTIAGNDIWAALGAGIKTAPFATGTSVVSGVTITGNTLTNVASGNAGDAGIELMDYTTAGSSGAGWQDIVISGNTISGVTNTAGAAIYAGQGTGLTVSGNTLDGLSTLYGIDIGNNNGTTSSPVRDFTVAGNTIGMTASTGSGGAGVVVVDSADGTIGTNVIPGVQGGGSAGVLLVGVSATNLITGVVVSKNRLTGWDQAVQELDAGGQPDGNTISGNNMHGCTAGALATGPRTLCQQPVPDIGGVELAEQLAVLSAAYTLTSTASAQKLFNSTANGTLTVPAGTLFFFEAEFDLTAMSATSGTFSFGLGGTATFTSLKYLAAAQKSATAGTLATWPELVSVTAAATVLVAASTTTTGAARLRGVLRTNAAGTVIPQVTLSVAAAAVVGANSWFRLWPVGTGAAVAAGNWS
jgi:polygalacturonase